MTTLHNHLNNRFSMPTELGSADLAALPAFVKSHVFFSARVAEARILEQLRKISDAHSRGDFGVDAARGKLRRFLERQSNIPTDDLSNTPPSGMSASEWAQAKKISNLGSTARLNLILNQNRRMASSVRRYREATTPEAMSSFPAWRYRSRHDSATRDSHAELDGKVFLKSDPVWQRIFPPWEYNCRCYVEEVSSAELTRRGGPDSYSGIPALPKSGYEFNVAEAFRFNDISDLGEARSKIFDQMKSAVASGHLNKVGLIAAHPQSGIARQNVENIDQVRRAFGAMQSAAKADMLEVSPDIPGSRNYNWINELYGEAGMSKSQIPSAVLKKFPGTIELGSLNPRLAQATGLGELPIRLSAGDRYKGISHLWSNHKDLFADPKRAAATLAKTLSDPGSRAVLSLQPYKRGGERATLQRLALHNVARQSYCILQPTSDGTALEIVSWHDAPESYGTDQWALK